MSYTRLEHEYRWEATPGKKRYGRFYAYVAEGLATMSLEDAALEAGRKMGWMSNRHGAALSDRSLRRKVDKLLARPDTPVGIRKAVEAVTGFGAPEMIQKVVDHIEGRVSYEETAVTKDGEVVRYEKTLPPSQDMLKKLMDVTMPKAPKQVNVDQRMLIGRIPEAQGPPAMRARVLDVALPPAETIED